MNSSNHSDNPRGPRAAMLLLLLLLVAVALFSVAASAPTTASNSDLLAHGSEENVWVAQILKRPTEKTVIRARTVPDSQWQELLRLNGRAIDLASRGTSLAVLMENGDWLLVWSGGFSTGPALPNGMKLLAIATDRDMLLGIGAPGGAGTGSSAATTPSTAAASTTTSPAGSKLTVFSFDGP